MTPDRITVFLPCHSLHDFPSWLEEGEADALLAAWTAAWHPWLIAVARAAPRWASVDLPPTDAATLGIVPAPWDDRFAAQVDAVCTADCGWVRGVCGREAIVAAAAAAVTDGPPPAAPLPGSGLAADFHALGLAALLAELVAQRMRSTSGLDTTDFAATAVRAATAAVAGDDASAQAALRECHGILEATRAHYYPVDCWLIDLVLLADSTLGPGLDRELDAPVPLGLVATGQVLERLAHRNPAALARIRARAAAGTLDPVGGRLGEEWFDTGTPEQAAASFARGRGVWQDLVGSVPVTYGQQTGGATALLPDLLVGLGYTGMVWTLFDGTPLPDPAASRVRWKGQGGGSLDGVARGPLDARAAQTILALPDRLGDAMDHDHTAVLLFAHHAGTASPWFDDLRRIGAAGTALGTFVTPAELFRRTPGAGTLVSFEPDAFPVGPAPAHVDPAREGPGSDPIAAGMVATAEEARRILEARRSLASVLPATAASASGGGPGVAAATGRQRRGWGIAGLLGNAGRADEGLVLAHDRLRVEVHRGTGGLLSLRHPADRGNRLSQRLAVRTTRPAPAVGQPWEDVTDRAVHSGMAADAIERVPAAEGRGEAILSRGRLVDDRQRTVGTFTQRVELVPGLPLAVLDVEVRLVEAPRGPLFEHHAACRFAWNENDDLDVSRSLLTQSVVTERGRFTAPWFLELGRTDDAGNRVTILTGGLPWHVRTSPHMIDTVLPAAVGAAAPCRLALGVGLERPWDIAVALLAGLPTAAWQTAWPAGVPDNVRLTVADVRHAAGRITGARVGLLESAGTAGEVRLEWAAAVTRASVCGEDGRSLPPADTTAKQVAVAGGRVTVMLRRHEWLHLDVEFAS